MHTLLQAAIVAVSLATPNPKPVHAPQVVPVIFAVHTQKALTIPQVVQVNLGVTRVLPTASKPVAVVLPTMKVSAR